MIYEHPNRHYNKIIYKMRYKIIDYETMMYT